jgi:hypothetical protein
VACDSEWATDVEMDRPRHRGADTGNRADRGTDRYAERLRCRE